jgi:hypothetical protein
MVMSNGIFGTGFVPFLLHDDEIKKMEMQKKSTNFIV